MSSPTPGSPPSSTTFGGPEASIVLSGSVVGSPSESVTDLPYRKANQALSNLFASTSSLPRPSSKPSSGAATPTLSGTTAFSPSDTSRTRSPARGPLPSEASGLRDLIVKSFTPRVAVLASPATDELIRHKGIAGGFLQLVRPFGEQVQGKVTIRNSVGASSTCEDFGIIFTGLKDGLTSPRPPLAPRRSGDTRRSIEVKERGVSSPSSAADDAFPAWTRVGGDVGQVEEVVDRHLTYAESRPLPGGEDYFSHNDDERARNTSPDAPSPFYMLYLRRLLSAFPLSPHETFSHPVACMIAISSHDPSPIEDLRRLYDATNRGDYRLPQWVNNEFLRYYVLVHDEDRDEAKASTALYEQMKRHFGLHCHLLRIRSNQCLPSDDESLKLPTTEWVSAAEELAEIQKREASEDDTDPTPYIFDTDATSLRTMVRELVVQSIIPSMERSLSSWSESVLSRRRGISGRFMSLSKRWTPFGSSSSSRSSSGSGSGGGGPLAALQSSGGSSGNYDSLQGFYKPDSPEATLRKLADYAVMLRDWKLASSTYDLLRSDFASDKAWRYYAGACEMCVVTTLLDVLARGHAAATGSSGGKARLEGIDSMLEAASYSYVTRCIAPYYALRALALGTELLKMRSRVSGPGATAAADDAGRWLCRIIEGGLVTRVDGPLTMERISVVYAARIGVGRLRYGSRQRRAAFWAVLATEAWLRSGKVVQAERMFQRVDELFERIGRTPGAELEVSGEKSGPGVAGQNTVAAIQRISFGQMRTFVESLRQTIMARKLASQQQQSLEYDGDASSAAAASPSLPSPAPVVQVLDPDDPLGAGMLNDETLSEGRGTVPAASPRVRRVGRRELAIDGGGDEEVEVLASESLGSPVKHRRGKSHGIGAESFDPPDPVDRVGDGEEGFGGATLG